MSWLIVLLTFLLASVNSVNEGQYSKISVIIPAYNEEGNVGRIVGIIKELSYIDDIVVVDDGSTDKTKIEAEFAGARVLSNSVNSGKGSAITKGIRETDGDIIAIIDADLHNLTASKVEKMLKPVLEGKADITKTKFSRVSGYSTELKTKPLLNYFFPEIKFEQPLNGQFVAKRKALKNMKFEEDYGVDIGIILDASAKGIKIVEVDIGEAKDKLTSLQELNLRANGVFRTIIDRATDYGRFTMMDSVGKNLSLFILSVALMILGLFILFFVRLIPMGIGIILCVVGLILAVMFLIKLLNNLFKLFKNNRDKNTLLSFLKMHYPALLTVIALFLITLSFMGAATFTDGTISIDPNSRKFVVYSDTNTSIPVAGPYVIDSAIENETNIIRMPLDAMNTLGISSNDNITIHNNNYIINQSRASEQDVLRMPFAVKDYLNLSDGDLIQNINLANLFNGCKVVHSVNEENISLTENFIISNNTGNSYDVAISIDGKDMVSDTFILNDSSNYKLSVDNSAVSIALNGSDYENTFDYNGHSINIKIIKSSEKTFKELSTVDIVFDIVL